MAWFETVSTTITAVELGAKLINASSTLKSISARLIYRIVNGAVVIPVFGCGGAGKSTASRLLGGADPLDITGPYEESWQIEPVNLVGDVPGTILAAPGQIERVDRYWPELFRTVLDGRNVGIVNVVSFGYHSLNINTYQEHDIYSSGMSVNEFVAAYTSARRDLEVEMLERVLNGMAALQTPLWIVTLVNKQDLWWKHAAAVRKHYELGAYQAALDRFRASIGSRSFQHEYIPVSLTMSNLITGSGQVLVETAGGYGMPAHISAIQSMLTQVQGIVE